MGENNAAFVANLTCFCYEAIYLNELVMNFREVKGGLPRLHPSCSQIERSDLQASLETLRDPIETVSIHKRYIDDSTSL